MDVNVSDLLSESYSEISELRQSAIRDSQTSDGSPSSEFREYGQNPMKDADANHFTRFERLWGAHGLQTGAMNQNLGNILSLLGKCYRNPDRSEVNYIRWPSEAVFPLVRSALEISATLIWLFEYSEPNERRRRLESYLQWAQFWETQAARTAPEHIVEQFGLVVDRFAGLVDESEQRAKFSHSARIKAAFGKEGEWNYNLWSALGHGGNWPSHYARKFTTGEHLFGRIEGDNEAHVQAAEFTVRSIAKMLDERAKYFDYSQSCYQNRFERLSANLVPYCSPGRINY